VQTAAMGQIRRSTERIHVVTKPVT